MDLHEYYTNLPPIDLPLLLNFPPTPQITSTLHRLAKTYNELLLEKKLQPSEAQTFRSILCHFYQSNFQNQILPPELIPSLRLLEVLNLSDEHFPPENQSLHDIVVLQVVLFLSNQLPDIFSNIHFNHPNFNQTTTLEILVSSLRLLEHLDSGFRRSPGMRKVVLQGLQAIVRELPRFDFLRTARFLLVCIEDQDDTLEDIWRTLVANRRNQEVFNLLCFLTGSLIQRDCQVLRKLLYDRDLWTYYLENLNDPVPARKKQVNFMITNALALEVVGSPQEGLDDGVVPFVCRRNSREKSSVSELKRLFLLTLDALEESQMQFALQAVRNLDKLVEQHLEHRNCGNCFGSVWLEALLERVLSHGNRTVVLEGLRQAMAPNQGFYSPKLLQAICRALNDVRYFRSNVSLGAEMEGWMQRMASGGVDAVPLLLEVLGQQLWNPVVIFHVFQAMSRVNGVTSFWGEDSLKLVQEVARRSQGRPMRLIHRCLNRAILKTLTKFVKVKDLESLSSLLHLLLENEPREDVWEEVAGWLAGEDVQERAQHFVQRLLSQDSRIEVASGVSVLVLLAKSKLVFQTPGCPTMRILVSHFSCLEHLASRPYCEVAPVIRLIEIMTLLARKSDCTRCINRCLKPFWVGVGDFVSVKLMEPSNLNYLQTTVLIEAVEMVRLVPGSSEILESIKHTSLKTLERVLQKPSDLRYPFAVGVLRSYSKALNHGPQATRENDKEVVRWILRVCTVKPVLPSEDPLRDTILSDFYANVLRTLAIDVGFQAGTLEEVVKLLQSATKRNTPLALEVLAVCCNRFPEEHLVSSGAICRLCWKASLDCKSSGYFRPAVDKTVEIMGTLCARFHRTIDMDLVREIVEKILEEGNKVPGLKMSLLKYRGLFESRDIRDRILLEGLLHGDVLRQDQIIEIETCDRLLEDEDIEFEELWNYNLDAMTRMTALRQLWSSEDESRVLELLMRKLADFKDKRYFKDSLTHKQCLRILQGVLVTMRKMSWERFEEILPVLVAAFLDGNHQTSVRILIEWIFTLACHYYETFWREGIWTIMGSVEKKRPNYLDSVFRIVYNAFRSLKGAMKNIFGEIVLEEMSHFCMDQKFATRLHSQFVIKKLYESLEESLPIKRDLSYMYRTIEKSLQTGKTAVIYKSVEENFFVSDFSPIDHYTVECVFCYIPRLMSVCSTEYITPLIMKKLFGPTENIPNIPDVPVMIEENEPIAESNTEFQGDAQKKIMPWKSVDRKESVSDLIVVASLVERIPNLGGIARTCEIFGTKEMVISNIQHIDNKEFLNLSVSAEKWLTISEVKPYQLAEYLAKKKTENYSIIGAEQTVNSVSLKDLKWERKTVLVLGHEKKGIPADIIPILDRCVEIPQIGITRSLNVHVSGALCIWQYAVQNLF